MNNRQRDQKGFTLFIALIMMGTLLLIAAGIVSLATAANLNTRSTPPTPVSNALSFGTSKILPGLAPLPPRLPLVSLAMVLLQLLVEEVIVVPLPFFLSHSHQIHIALP